MKKVYADNGLPFWSEQEVLSRDYLTQYLSKTVQSILLDVNRAWVFERIEAPTLIPLGLISKEYDVKDIFSTGTFGLRPETTASSYTYLKQRFAANQANPPYCVWQLGKSFRNEHDNVSKNMRFKEFYQLEFQCIYTKETLNDYHNAVLEPLRAAVERLLGGLQVRVVESDRLPSYSLKTMDLEVDMGHKWLEVCSISLRNDVPFDWKGKDLQNVEIAFGADRLVGVLNE